MKPSSPEAFRLVMEGSAAFTDIEHHGMRVDVDYLDRAIEETGIRIREIEDELRQTDVFGIWRKRYGQRAELGSRTQLGEVIFGQMGIECKHKTKTGRSKTDAEALEDVDLPFVKRWVELEKLKKVRGTNLIGIRAECVDGFLHPFFHLHLASTHRSSSSDINFQNLPVRDKEQSKLVRTAFVCRDDDYVIVEQDYGALEFRGAACFWKDPAMVAYASDPSLDIHRDMAAECYRLPLEKVSKQARSFAKNQFVFPILYGSYYGNCAQHLWSQIGRGGVKDADGLGLYEHLENVGICEYPAFETHIKGVEQRFNERFPTWSKEKERWWNLYLERGWFRLATGFVCAGRFSYNNLMNTPIQGSSFHCLLWSVIEINKWLKKNKMKSMIVGQIHDSIRADVHKDELDDYLEVSERIMTKEIRKAWKWIITPLEVESEISYTNWYEKKPVGVAA